jgi:hypothetical protein
MFHDEVPPKKKGSHISQQEMFHDEAPPKKMSSHFTVVNKQSGEHHSSKI